MYYRIDAVSSRAGVWNGIMKKNDLLRQSSAWNGTRRYKETHQSTPPKHKLSAMLSQQHADEQRRVNGALKPQSLAVTS